MGSYETCEGRKIAKKKKSEKNPRPMEKRNENGQKTLQSDNIIKKMQPSRRAIREGITLQ